MFKNYNSQEPSTPSKWEDRQVIAGGIRPDASVIAISPQIRLNTETAANYSRYYHEGKNDEILKLLHPTCQFGTFFGFVWGPTAINIALLEEQKMSMKFIGKLLTYSSHHQSTFAKETGKVTGSAKAIQNAWFAPSDVGLHKGAGAPAFARVTENIFERDGIAKRNHRGFPYVLWDNWWQLKIRETIVVEDGLITSRILQNLTNIFPLPYDFM
jgi:hypothetical protein